MAGLNYWMLRTAGVPLDPCELDELDEAILDYLIAGRPDEPWGKATPMEVYRSFEEQGVLAELDDPSYRTIQNRIQRMALAGHLENQFDTGNYELVDDPRDD